MSTVPEPGVLQIMAVFGSAQDTAQALWNGFVAARALASGLPAPRRCRVTAATLNVRAGPSATAAVLDKLAQGALVQVWGQYGDWCVIDLPCGFVAAAYLEAV